MTDQAATSPTGSGRLTTASQALALALVKRTGGEVPGKSMEASMPVQGKRGRPSRLTTPLARVMKANGHSNLLLARHLDCGLRTVEYWVTGEKEIPERYIHRLCLLYHRDSEYFEYDPDEPVIDEEAYRIAEEFFSYSTDPLEDECSQ